MFASYLYGRAHKLELAYCLEIYMQHAASLPLAAALAGVQGRHVLIAALALSTLMVGCSSRTSRAPIADLSDQAPSAQTVGGARVASYIVKPGDTLYKIAQENNTDIATLIRLNNISDPSLLRPGQTLSLQAGAAGTVASSQTPSTPPVSTAPVAPVKPVATETPSSAPRASDANLISWDWPANGKIIQGFNASTKGIDIEGKVGDPVQAAADGKVMYAGNGVRGLGSMVLVGHSNGFITAYAHNNVLHVKAGQEVKRGQRIADLGQSDTTSPRLHFEIRRSGNPVNPLSYLPQR